METKDTINSCLELFHKIEEEYPEEPNIEELHEVAGKYAQLKEYRRRINEYSKEIRSFCEFINAIRCSREILSGFFSFILHNPDAFSSNKKETFLEKNQRIKGMSANIGITSTILLHILSIARLKGLLGCKNELRNEYRELIEQYLK